MNALNQSIESKQPRTPDVCIINGSSVFLFVLLTDRAREWRPAPGCRYAILLSI
jgi:hypothetical protein